MAKKVLVVEDEELIRLTLCDRLEGEGYITEQATDGESGTRLATQNRFDLIILDLMMPKKNGFDVCRDLRAAGVSVPILVLTARSQTIDKVLALKIGADDYVTKPFDAMELMARVEALLRRAQVPAGTGVHQVGEIEVDLRGTTVTRGGKAVPLSAREFQLLRYMLEHRGTTLSRDLLLKEVWQYHASAFTRTVDVHIASLRQKLESDPKNPVWIVTVPGLGYKLSKN